ncbi:MAG: MotA/TolQ/ExbB proton channel family protein [Gammaproteobacteria bacterium]|nr:MotA/TolQ/ExbB proton channel family protein [Gammaproteobacteria bacterium]
MKKVLFILLVLAGTAAPADVPNTLDELLEQTRKQRTVEREESAAREQRFIEAKEQQRALLEEAKAALAGEEVRGEQLRKAYEEKEQAIEAQEALLTERAGSLGELHGIVREAAGNLKGILASSLVSAQKPDRAPYAEALAESQELPSIEELEGLWLLALEEMVESGKVVRFPAKVITGAGEEKEQQVTRIGVFDAVTDGRFLRYLPEAGKLVEPQRQPALHFQRMALNLDQASSGIVAMPIDPTRGAILALLIQTPDIATRINQGGIVGYIIMALGGLALLIALQRFIILTAMDRTVQRQMRQDTPNANNPLGRIMAVYTENPRLDAETLGLKLDEAILSELPPIQRGLGSLAILAAVAPLLGLLGTVIGIIQTFQAITLFGTGDPRLMSGGISVALVTTVQGLLVAIPILLIHSFLSSKSNQLIQILDKQSAAMVAKLAEQRHAQAV